MIQGFRVRSLGTNGGCELGDWMFKAQVRCDATGVPCRFRSSSRLSLGA